MSQPLLSDTRRACVVGVITAGIGVSSAAWCVLRAWHGCAAGNPDLFGVVVQLLLALALGWATALVALAVRSLRSSGAHHDHVALRDRLVHRIAGLLLMVGGGLATTTPYATAAPIPTVVATVSTDVPDPGFTTAPAPRALPTAPSDAHTDPDAAPSAPVPSPDLDTTTWTAPRPPSTTPRDASLMTEPSRDDHLDGVVVRRGDCLWTIVSRHLGPRADVTLVAAAVREWHHTNRVVIGADPNRLVPGQVLRIPGGTR